MSARAPATLSRWVLGTSALAMTLGAALGGYAWVLRGRASSEMREGSYVAVSRTRTLDEIAAGHDSTSAVRRWVADARDGEERSVTGALAACLEGGGSCPAEVDAARELYAGALATTWTEAEDRESRADVLLLASGVLLLLGGLAPLGFVWLRAPEAPPPAAASVAPEADARGDRVTPEVESLLRQRLEDLYAARKRVWESERFAAYGELAAGLSHGLKTPLASIRAATQVALKRLGPDHAASAQLRDVIDEVDGLVEQVRRFLSATGTGGPVPARVAPGQIIDAIGTSYAHTTEARGVSLRTESAAGLSELLVDAALLEMALRNLVENALAAAPRGSEVVLRAKAAETPSRVGLDNEVPTHAEWVELSVSDRGGGIPAEVLESRAVPSKKPEGSGLGLAIARRIAERHGGALVVETGEQGTTVRLVLPTPDATATSHEPEAA